MSDKPLRHDFDSMKAIWGDEEGWKDGRVFFAAAGACRFICRHEKKYRCCRLLCRKEKM